MRSNIIPLQAATPAGKASEPRPWTERSEGSGSVLAREKGQL